MPSRLRRRSRSPAPPLIPNGATASSSPTHALCDGGLGDDRGVRKANAPPVKRRCVTRSRALADAAAGAAAAHCPAPPLPPPQRLLRPRRSASVAVPSSSTASPAAAFKKATPAHSDSKGKTRGRRAAADKAKAAEKGREATRRARQRSSPSPRASRSSTPQSTRSPRTAAATPPRRIPRSASTSKGGKKKRTPVQRRLKSALDDAAVALVKSSDCVSTAGVHTKQGAALCADLPLEPECLLAALEAVSAVADNNHSVVAPPCVRVVRGSGC